MKNLKLFSIFLMLLWPVFLFAQYKINTKFVPPKKCITQFSGDIGVTATSNCKVMYIVSIDLKRLLIRLYPEINKELNAAFDRFVIRKLPDDTIRTPYAITLPTGYIREAEIVHVNPGAIYFSATSDENYSPGKEVYWSGFVIEGKSLSDYLVDIYRRYPNGFPEIKKMMEDRIIIEIPGTGKTRFKLVCK